MSAGTGPQPDLVIFLSSHRARIVVLGRDLVHRDVRWRVQRDEREVSQVDLVDLIKDLLPRSWIGRSLFLREQGIQLMVAVEVDVEASRRELVATEQ